MIQHQIMRISFRVVRIVMMGITSNLPLICTQIGRNSEMLEVRIRMSNRKPTGAVARTTIISSTPAMNTREVVTMGTTLLTGGIATTTKGMTSMINNITEAHQVKEK